MKPEINILCLYWVGDFRGRDFVADDVWRLYHSVLKHADRPFDFFVLTNNINANLPGTKIRLEHDEDWPGWWSKMELYRPGILPKRRTLYMDLDSHAIRGLAPIFDFEGDLVMFNTKDKKHIRKHAKQGINGMVYRYQAATILYDPWKWEWLYEKFLADWNHYLEHYRSDQDILGEWIPDQPCFPDTWLMKIGQIEKNLAFHNRPPAEVLIITGQTRLGLFRNTEKIKWFEKMAR